MRLITDVVLIIVPLSVGKIVLSVVRDVIKGDFEGGFEL